MLLRRPQQVLQSQSNDNCTYEKAYRQENKNRRQARHIAAKGNEEEFGGGVTLGIHAPDGYADTEDGVEYLAYEQPPVAQYRREDGDKVHLYVATGCYCFTERVPHQSDKFVEMDYEYRELDDETRVT